MQELRSRRVFYREEGSCEQLQCIDGEGNVLQTFDEYRPLQSADLYFELRHKTVEKVVKLAYAKGAIWIARAGFGSLDLIMRHGESFID